MANELTNLNVLLNQYQKDDPNLWNLLSAIVNKLSGFSDMSFDGIPLPMNSREGKGKLLFDRSHSKFQISENGRSFVDAQPHECARVYNSADFAVPNTALTPITFNSERYDTDTLHSIAANTSRFTARWPGEYSIGGNVEFEAVAAGVRILSIRINGATQIASLILPSLGAVYPTRMNLHCTYQLATTDYVELCAFQDSGGAINVLHTDGYSPEFWIRRNT